MVSVASLLNPEPPRAPLPTSRPIAAVRAPQTLSFHHETTPARPSVETLRMAKNANPPAGCKAKGVVNFPPFETLDDAALREIRRFQVHPFGSIQDTCRRIPYNSGKKDFYSKTGREFFEVFQYEFRVPGDDTPYTIMWDYSVGLVRMTPFFKCRGYSKTTPAKMLSQNPGLKDITYSITGGAIKAQGYWMPFACAKAVCLTFCHKIAGALVPLFGPRFLYDCVPEKTTGHGRMIIDPDIVLQAKRDASAVFNPRYALPSPRSSRSASPLPSQRPTRRHGRYNYRTEYDRQLLLSPHVTDTDVDSYPRLESYGRSMHPLMPPLRTAGRRIALPPTPLHSPGGTTVNLPYHHMHHHRSTSHPHEELHSLSVNPTANPWLSAIPRSPTPVSTSGRRYPFRQASSSSTSFPEQYAAADIHRGPSHGTKRGFGQMDTHNNNDDDDNDYDAGESNPSRAGSTPSIGGSRGQEHTDVDDDIRGPVPPALTVAAETGIPRSNPTTRTAQPDCRGAGVGSANNPRRASERDAATMLMHMMRGKNAGGGCRRTGDADGDVDADSRGRDSPPKDDGGGDGDGDGDGDGRRGSEPASPPRVIVLMRPQTPASRTGSNTRAKRRRTQVG
ncbi:hypothetical protein BT67DRAFT_217408 [Trichocladium antarcticum]|uniref:HTH APSES-type domain-containing protein n=1 Tax=Trichocladium antarcticum TaxID=1450529 RepID=A0AAN6UCN3_9PEZI|nr:hypothetical protein BT67DRAFT_217408 [Trichocladium antarcticum]